MEQRHRLSEGESAYATKLHSSNFTIFFGKRYLHRDCFLGERPFHRVEGNFLRSFTIEGPRA